MAKRVKIKDDRSMYYFDTDLLGVVGLIPFADIQRGRDVTVYEMVLTPVPMKTFSECCIFVGLVSEAARMMDILNEGLMTRETKKESIGG